MIFYPLTVYYKNMDTAVNPYPPKQNSYIPTAFKLVLVILIILLVGIGSYLFGQKSQPGKPIPPSQQADKWPEIQYEYSQGYAFNVNYPADAQVLMFDGKSSGLPVSPLQQLLAKAISFSAPPDSQDRYNVVIGLSDTDPSDALTTITKSETLSISGTSAKKIEGTAPNGGGVLLPSLPQITLYIIPYLNKFLILYSDIGDGSTFNKMVDSFRMIKY